MPEARVGGVSCPAITQSQKKWQRLSSDRILTKNYTQPNDAHSDDSPSTSLVPGGPVLHVLFCNWAPWLATELRVTASSLWSSLSADTDRIMRISAEAQKNQLLSRSYCRFVFRFFNLTYLAFFFRWLWLLVGAKEEEQNDQCCNDALISLWM